MILDRRKPVNATEWHCPFPMAWVKRMRRAVERCRFLTREDIEAIDNHVEKFRMYHLPPGDFLSEPQAPNGLPLSWNREDQCVGSYCDIYDFTYMPEMVVTDGRNDWPLYNRHKVQQAI